MISILSACSSTTSDFSGIAMGDKHFRKANMGDSVAKVMASEKGDFVEEITADSEEGKKYFSETDQTFYILINLVHQVRHC